jgi:hypothetical protein
MNIKTLKILRAVSRISFGALIAIFLGGIFSVKLSNLLDRVSVPLFVTALITEIAYQLFSGISDRTSTNKKLHAFRTLPHGNYKIIEKGSSLDLGTLTNDEIDYLRKKFLQNGMDDNDFYFNSMTFGLFKKKENPSSELTNKIEAILKLKDPVEISWLK